MATLTPKVLIGPAQSLTATPATYVSGSGITGVIRTVVATAQTTALTLTIALGADAAGTRVWPTVALASLTPYVFNGWVLTATNNTHAIDATSNATGSGASLVICNISGYESQ